MQIQVRRVEYRDVESLRGLYRQEANCQIIHDSALGRGIADAYLIEVDGIIAGYGGVWNKYSPDRVMEFHTLPARRASALPMFRELLAVSGAKAIEAQTNMPLMLLMLLDCGVNIFSESILFTDAFTSNLPNPGARFRAATAADASSASDEQTSSAARSPTAPAHALSAPAGAGQAAPPPAARPDGDWLLEAGDDGAIVAAGGFLCHYNPPYGDIYMSVAESARQRGFGSYIVQELKRVCYEAGRKPAARCNPANVASRRTLQKAGLLPCGRLLVGNVPLPAASMESRTP